MAYILESLSNKDLRVKKHYGYAASISKIGCICKPGLYNLDRSLALDAISQLVPI